jgi:tetratricopeptide (TPR) repeat protein
VIPRTELAGEHDPAVPKDYLTQNLIGHFHYTLGFTFEQRDWLRARAELEQAAEAAPDNDVLFYNLGLVYARNGLYDDALAAFGRSEQNNPRALASSSKSLASAKLAEIAALRIRVRGIEDRLLTEHRDLARAETPEFHERMAELLSGAHEDIAARGHRLRAEELRAASRRSEPHA